MCSIFVKLIDCSILMMKIQLYILMFSLDKSLTYEAKLLVDYLTIFSIYTNHRKILQSCQSCPLLLGTPDLTHAAI